MIFFSQLFSSLCELLALNIVRPSTESDGNTKVAPGDQGFQWKQGWSHLSFRLQELGLKMNKKYSELRLGKK